MADARPMCGRVAIHLMLTSVQAHSVHLFCFVTRARSSSFIIAWRSGSVTLSADAEVLPLNGPFRHHDRLVATSFSRVHGRVVSGWLPWPSGRASSMRSAMRAESIEEVTPPVSPATGRGWAPCRNGDREEYIHREAHMVAPTMRGTAARGRRCSGAERVLSRVREQQWRRLDHEKRHGRRWRRRSRWRRRRADHGSSDMTRHNIMTAPVGALYLILYAERVGRGHRVFHRCQSTSRGHNLRSATLGI